MGAERKIFIHHIQHETVLFFNLNFFTIKKKNKLFCVQKVFFESLIGKKAAVEMKFIRIKISFYKRKIDKHNINTFYIIILLSTEQL
jgi:hypothetical protein